MAQCVTSTPVWLQNVLITHPPPPPDMETPRPQQPPPHSPPPPRAPGFLSLVLPALDVCCPRSRGPWGTVRQAFEFQPRGGRGCGCLTWSPGGVMVLCADAPRRAGPVAGQGGVGACAVPACVAPTRGGDVRGGGPRWFREAGWGGLCSRERQLREAGPARTRALPSSCPLWFHSAGCQVRCSL